MSSILPLAKAALVALSAFGCYSTWYLFLNNGSADLLAAARDSGTLPGTDAPITTSFTGISWLDHQLVVLGLFFWEVVDGSNPTASLFGYHFAGQVVTVWGFLTVESLRKGNRGRLVSYIGIWGVLIQNFVYAIVGPIYLLVHLATSPTVKAPSSKVLEVERSDVLSIFPALLAAYVLPTVLMGLPAPSVIGFNTKKACIASWQFFPLWVSIDQLVVSQLIKVFWPGKAQQTAHPMKYLRILYGILLASSVLNHLSVLQFLATSHFFSGLFAKGFEGVWRFPSVFLPKAITPAVKMETIGDGALLLLKYDEMTVNLSVSLWAIVVLLCAIRQRKMKLREHKLIGLGLAVLAVVLPMGFAVTLLWIRDELVIREVEQEKKV